MTDEQKYNTFSPSMQTEKIKDYPKALGNDTVSYTSIYLANGLYTMRTAVTFVPHLLNDGN